LVYDDRGLDKHNPASAEKAARSTLSPGYDERGLDNVARSNKAA